VTGRAVPHRIADRRPGDPPVLVASSALLRAETGWTPRFPGLHDIVRPAAAWRDAHPEGYGD
jgi:UDP-glucose 4-epimerase